MDLDIREVEVWSGSINDDPGALAEKVAILAKAGEDLDFVVARRLGSDRAVMFVAPIRDVAAAAGAGLTRATDLHALRVEARNRSGLGAEMMRLIGEDGISVRGLSVAVIGELSVTYLAFDNEAEARKARTTLELDLRAIEGT